MANAVRPNTFVDSEVIDALRMNEDFDTLYTWISAQAMHRDGTVAFELLPSGPGGGSLPTQDQQLANKLYVDNQTTAATAAALATVNPARRDTKSDSPSIPDSSETPITFETTTFQQGGAGEIPTKGGSTFTIKKAGLYLVQAGVDLSTGGVSGRHVQLRLNKNGSAIAAYAGQSGANGTARMNVSTMHEFDVNDTCEARVFHISSGGASATLTANGMTFFSLAYLGAK